MIGNARIQQQNEREDKLNNKKITTGSRIAAVIGMAIPREIRFTPEGKLWLAVIKTALVDADGKGEKAKSAKRFLVGEDFEIVSDLIGLNYVYAQELIRDHAKWANHG